MLEIDNGQSSHHYNIVDVTKQNWFVEHTFVNGMTIYLKVWPTKPERIKW